MFTVPLLCVQKQIAICARMLSAWGRMSQLPFVRLKMPLRLKNDLFFTVCYNILQKIGHQRSPNYNAKCFKSSTDIDQG